MEVIVYTLFFIQIFLAVEIAAENKDNKETQDDLWERISRDDYMKYAVEECYHGIKLMLTAILDDDGRKWYVLSFVDNGMYCYNLPIML